MLSSFPITILYGNQFELTKLQINVFDRRMENKFIWNSIKFNVIENENNKKNRSTDNVKNVIIKTRLWSNFLCSSFNYVIKKLTTQ